MRREEALEEYGRLTEVSARQLATTQACCGNESWRGRLCEFHQGFEAGMDAVVELLPRDVVLRAMGGERESNPADVELWTFEEER